MGKLQSAFDKGFTVDYCHEREACMISLHTSGCRVGGRESARNPCSLMNCSNSGCSGMSRSGSGAACQKGCPGNPSQPMRVAGFLSSSRATRSSNSGDAPRQTQMYRVTNKLHQHAKIIFKGPASAPSPSPHQCQPTCHESVY